MLARLVIEATVRVGCDSSPRDSTPHPGRRRGCDDPSATFTLARPPLYVPSSGTRLRASLNTTSTPSSQPASTLRIAENPDSCLQAIQQPAAAVSVVRSPRMITQQTVCLLLSMLLPADQGPRLLQMTTAKATSTQTHTTTPGARAGRPMERGLAPGRVRQAASACSAFHDSTAAASSPASSVACRLAGAAELLPEVGGGPGRGHAVDPSLPCWPRGRSRRDCGQPRRDILWCGVALGKEVRTMFQTVPAPPVTRAAACGASA
jgi:hypothetical protein